VPTSSETLDLARTDSGCTSSSRRSVLSRSIQVVNTLLYSRRLSTGVTCVLQCLKCQREFRCPRISQPRLKACPWCKEPAPHRGTHFQPCFRTPSSGSWAATYSRPQRWSDFPDRLHGLSLEYLVYWASMSRFS
jgi:hypothetical protein